ncbi:MAG: CaiB/BaiF CoA-transferase family protein [Promethearchaeota archaeon]
MTRLIFEGIRILDVSHFISGPWTTTFFAQQGAEVIKVEPPPFGDSFRMFSAFDEQIFPLFSILNNDKKSVVLNLRKPEAQEVFRQLVAKSDVVVDNLVVGTMDRWGVGYEQLKEVKPDLIYVSISGFGRTGLERYVTKSAFDLIAQAVSGTLDAMQVEQAPGVPFADYSTAHVAAIALASALYHRERTGQGQLIDVSMQDVMYAINIRAHAREFMARAARLHDMSRILPIYNQYPTSDGKKVAIVVLTEPQWKRLCERVLERPELVTDERFDNPVKRFDHVDELDEIVSEYTRARTREQVLLELEAQKIPCGAVLSVDEVRDHPQLAARGMLRDQFDFSAWGVEKATMPGPIVKYSGTPSRLERQAPPLGADTVKVLVEVLGYSEAEAKKVARKVSRA